MATVVLVVTVQAVVVVRVVKEAQGTQDKTVAMAEMAALAMVPVEVLAAPEALGVLVILADLLHQD